MSALGVVLIVIGVIALAGWVYFMTWLSDKTRIIKNFEKQQEAVLKIATPGDAKIIEVGASDTDGDVNVALRLEVTPQFGDSFNAITVWAIEPMHVAEIQIGKSIPVKFVDIPAFNSKEKTKCIYPDVAWAKQYSPREEFTEESMKTVMYRYK